MTHRDDSDRLTGTDLTLAYDSHVISTDLSVTVPDGGFTVIVGPNACGKSTLLRALGNLLRPQHGSILLDGKQIHEYGSKEVARRLGLLPQTAIAPDGITVADLVGRGRYPHQSLLRQWTGADESAVQHAMARTNVGELSARHVDELSGGQRQRVWLAMALAQETSIMLLDEPTTYLDIAHQLDVLDLCRELHEAGTTIVAVLHDLNHAARYASHLIAMNGGRIVADGTPGEVLTEALVEEVFGVASLIQTDPSTGTPMVIPLDRRMARSATGR